MRERCTIHSRRCWIDGSLIEACVTIQDGIIEHIRPGSVDSTSERLIDAGDAVLMPGVIDAHVHINDPGRSHWEGFETATKAAALGGTTTVVDMPLNSKPVTTSVPALEEKMRSALGNLNVHCAFYAGAIGQKVKTLKNVIEAGCHGVKAFLIDSGIDEFPPVDRKVLEQVMPLIGKSGVPLLVHAELDLSNGSLTDPVDPTSYAAYLASRPCAWENSAIRMLIELCAQHKCRTHIVHLSSAEALSEIIAAKEADLPLTVETCAHYLYFDAEDVPDAQPLFKCAPPIREKSNNALLRKAVRDGVIDFITTDHSPAPPGLKALGTGDLFEAWGGIAGIQFLLSASWSALRDTVSLEHFIPLLTSKPAHFLGLHGQKGRIAPGYDADLVVWSPEFSFVPTRRDIAFRHKQSPYLGQQLYGGVHHTFVAGYHVIDEGHFQMGGAGRALLRSSD